MLGMPPWLGAEVSATLRLAWPLIITQLLVVGTSFIDTVMAGAYGDRGLATIALGSALWHLLMIGPLGVVNAITAAVAQRRGAGREDLIASVFQHGCLLALALGLLIMIAAQASPWLLSAAGVAQDLRDDATAYTVAIAFGGPPLMLYLTLRYLADGLGYTKPAMVFGVLGLIVNVPLNYWFLYGGYGLPAFGPVGLGYASAIAFAIQALGLGLYIGYAPAFRRFRLYSDWHFPHWAPIQSLLAVGVPIGVAFTLEVGLFSVAALLMGRFGADVAAAHQIAINFASLTFMVPLGMAMAITVRVGQAAGSGSQVAVRRAGLTGIALALAAQSGALTIMIGFPELVVALYGATGGTALLAAELLFLAALFQISDGIQAASAGALRGLEDTRAVMLVTLIAYWPCGFALGWWLGVAQGYGPHGLWIGLIAGLSVAAVLLFGRFLILSGSPERIGRIGLRLKSRGVG